MPNNPFEPMIKNIGDYVSGTLFLQGATPNIGIDNYEGLALASPADTILRAAKDPVIDEIAVGMTGNQELSINTVAGVPPLQLPNSAGYPLQSWSVEVSPKQDLNGYDAPWPAGGGVNRFDETTGTYGDWIDGSGNVIAGAYGYISEKITVVASDTYCYKYYGASPYSAGLVEYADDDSFVKRTISINGYGTVVLQPETAYIRLIVSSPNGTQSTMTQELLASCEMMVTANSFADTYSPYSNICPILGTDKLNMFVDESYDPSATPKAVITLPQTVYAGTINDSEGESRWTLADLGDYPWTYVQPSTTFPNGLFYANFNDKVRNNELPMCTEYKPVLQSYGNQDFIIAGSDTGLIYVVDSRYNTPAVFQNGVRGVKVCYRLATPIQFAMTTPAIPTPTGSATTWATAEDGLVDSMEVTYVGKA